MKLIEDITNCIVRGALFQVARPIGTDVGVDGAGEIREVRGGPTGGKAGPCPCQPGLDL